MYTGVETVDLVSRSFIQCIQQETNVSIYLDSYEYHVSDTKRIT